MTGSMPTRKVKPYYGDGDHVLFADIISDLTPLQSMRPVFKYEQIVFGHEAVRLGVSAGINIINNNTIAKFADQCVTHWEFKAKVAEMFTTPSQRGILH